MKIKTIFLSVFLLLITDSTYVCNFPPRGYYISLYGVVAFGMFSLIKLLLKFWKDNKTPFSFAVVAILCGWVFIFSYFQGSGLGPSLSYVFIILTAYYVAATYDFDELMTGIVNALFVLAAAAVVIWLIVFIFPEVYNLLPPMDVVLGGVEPAVYRTVGLANMYWPFYEPIPRLYSVFWEPGVAQAYFNIAIILSLKLIKGKLKILYIAVFMIAVVLTLSTTGYIVSFAILLYILMSGKGEGVADAERDEESKVIGRLKIGILVGVTVLLIFLPAIISTDLYFSVFEKLTEGMENASVGSRLVSIFGNLELLMQHPLTGIGLNQAGWNMVNDYGYYVNQTNTVMNYFVTFGILIGTLFVLAWVSFIKSISHSTMKFVVLIISFLLIFSGESFMHSQFFNVLMMYGLIRLLDYRLLERKNIERSTTQ